MANIQKIMVLHPIFDGLTNFSNFAIIYKERLAWKSKLT